METVTDRPNQVTCQFCLTTVSYLILGSVTIASSVLAESMLSRGGWMLAEGGEGRVRRSLRNIGNGLLLAAVAGLG